MSQGNNGNEKYLETILAPIPDAHREIVTRAYYNTASGDPSCSVIQSTALQSAVAAGVIARLDGILTRMDALLARQTGPAGNGAQPGQVKPGQLEAIESALKDLKASQAELLKAVTERGGENKQLDAFLDSWSASQAWKSSKNGRVKHWAIRIGLLIIISALLGFQACWMMLHADFDARMDRLAAQRQTTVITPDTGATDHTVKKAELNKPEKQMKQ